MTSANLTDEKIETFSKNLLINPYIKGQNTIIILCEGATDNVILNNKKQSPSDRPDADFYSRCIPRYFFKPYPNPKFISCGTRDDVLNIYSKLLEIIPSTKEKYLEPNKLFALVDLDLQKKDIENYQFSNIDEIFNSIYENGCIKKDCKKNHIWVTGLIHKECYFILPKLQNTLNEYVKKIFYKNKELDINDIYNDMINDLTNNSDDYINNKDLIQNWDRAKERISFCNGLDFDNINKLQESYKNLFTTSNLDLIYSLLMISKAKKYWEQTTFNLQDRDNELKKELIRKIGIFYSKQEVKPENHIPSFFDVLYKTVYKQ